MGNNDYLQQILNSQTLTNDSGELKSLQKHRKDVEDLIRGEFSSSALSIRYGGSKAKGTMIKEAYDLDILCYFDHDDESPGETLEEIYDSIRKLLSTQYYVEQKASALRLKDKNTSNYAVDFHIDVVPGRFIDDSRKDVFLYQASGEKKRLKTNPNIHITYVKNSGHTEAIRLLKLWRVRNGLSIKHFALELLIIEILKGKGSNNLTGQLETVWTIFRDKIDEISIEDPANPTGNDLSALLDSDLGI